MTCFVFRLIVAGHMAAASILPCAPARADPRRLSQMPDPRGEFVRLCAPFMASRYAHPEAICDCVLAALRSEIDDADILDAVLYGVTERGVPSLSASWLPRRSGR
jgi:hypothetical protein